ncbi:MAG: FkbM family methyltransferase [Pseudomonadota bacterium]
MAKAAFSILDILLERPTIKVIDVGAMSLGDEHDAYAPLVQANIAEVVGFEPVAAECDKLNALGKPRHRFLPHIVGDGSVRTFHETNVPMTSSLYPPNSQLLDKFQNLENLTQVVRTESVQSERLDDIAEIDDCDFLKTDVQGAELDVFRGAPNLLQQVAVIHTEVEFVPMYQGQPLFAEVDRHLRDAGFAFHKLDGAAGRPFKPLMKGNNPNAPISQLLWADAVYAKDFMTLDRLPSNKLIAMAVILHEVYASVDLVHLALAAHDAREGGRLGAAYLEKLTTGTPKQD